MPLGGGEVDLMVEIGKLRSMPLGEVDPKLPDGAEHAAWRRTVDRPLEVQSGACRWDGGGRPPEVECGACR